MEQISVYNAIDKPDELEKRAIVDFLHDQLEEWGDPKKDIRKAMDYALKEFASFGGVVVTLKKEGEIRGAVIVNQTGMSGYIPENILVYIAVHRDARGEGIGKKLMKKTMNITNGDIALHVEADNPARHLYEKVGFTNPYLEMRFKRS